MTETRVDEALSQRIYTLVRQYVRAKAEAKAGMKFAEFSKLDNGRTSYPVKYREAIEKVCTDAFLAMRGRKDHDFVEYFSGTICSVPQFLPEHDYLLVTKALLDDWNTVKTLSMLAVSAASYLSQPKTPEGE